MAQEGISVEVADGFARIEFLDKKLRGITVTKLLDAGGPDMIDVDTSGARKTYIVPESVARQAGLIDEPEEKAPAKRAAPKKATTTSK
jgi:hypothetical protein